MQMKEMKEQMPNTEEVKATYDKGPNDPWKTNDGKTEGKKPEVVAKPAQA